MGIMKILKKKPVKYLISHRLSKAIILLSIRYLITKFFCATPLLVTMVTV